MSKDYAKVLKKLRDDATFFAEVFMNFKPFDYQKDLLETDADRVAACWGRQTGKTTTISVKTIHFAYTRPGTLTLIVSPGIRQSMIMFNKVKDTIFGNKVLAACVDRATRTEIRIKNGSRILALPCSEDGATLRGYTADLVIIDEAAFVPEQVITSVIMPMLACVVGETEMQLSNGQTLTAKEVYERKCDELMTFIDYKSCAEMPSSFIDSGVRECFEVVFAGGDKVIVTGNTKFPMKNGGWKQTSDITAGEWVLVPSLISIDGTVDVESWIPKFIGYMIADGCMSGSQCLWSKTESHIISDFNTFVKDGYTLKPAGRNQFVIARDDRKNPLGNDYIKILKDYGLWGCKSRDKHIPNVVFKWKNEHIASLLNRLFAGDSSIDHRSIRYDTVSTKLAKQVKTLLLRFGVRASIGNYYRDVWSVDIIGKRNLENFKSKIGIFGKDISKLYIPKREPYIKGDITAKRVKNITSVGKKQTYDFSLDSGHSYVANDLWIHNTTKTTRGTGKLFLISTPWGRNHIFYRCTTNPSYYSPRIESRMNPLITEEFLLDQRREIGEMRYMIEYEAKFVDDATTLFNQDMLRGMIEFQYYAPRAADDKPDLMTDIEVIEHDGMFDGQCVFGLDLGKRQDYTVLSVFRQVRRIIAIDAEDQGKVSKGGVKTQSVYPAYMLIYEKRFELKTAYTDIIAHVKAIYPKFNWMGGFIDQLGVGEAVCEEIMRDCPMFRGIMLQLVTKHSVLMWLYTMIEQRRVGITYDKVTIAEYSEQQYGYTRRVKNIEDLNKDEGMLRFWHPDGRHDDKLWSQALAIYAANPNPDVGRVW